MRNALGMALAAIMTICAFAARAEQTEYDPAKVSDGLKAIFQFGSTSTKQSLNANTVTLITGYSPGGGFDLYTRIVANHLGIPLAGGPYRGHADEVRAQWRTGLTRLAEYQVPTTRELEDFAVKKTAVWTLDA